jgi:hypothetical protein
LKWSASLRRALGYHQYIEQELSAVVFRVTGGIQPTDNARRARVERAIQKQLNNICIAVEYPQ